MVSHFKSVLTATAFFVFVMVSSYTQASTVQVTQFDIPQCEYVTDYEPFYKLNPHMKYTLPLSGTDPSTWSREQMQGWFFVRTSVGMSHFLRIFGQDGRCGLALEFKWAGDTYTPGRHGEFVIRADENGEETHRPWFIAGPYFVAAVRTVENPDFFETDPALVQYVRDVIRVSGSF